jgi:hypothetical protein
MREKFKAFIFDLDDTIVETDPAFWNIAYALTGIKKSEEDRKHRKHLHLSKCDLEYTEEHERRVIALMDTMRCWERLEFFTDAIKLIYKAYTAGYNVYYVTARDSYVRNQTLHAFGDVRVTDKIDSQIVIDTNMIDNNLYMSDTVGDKEKNLKIVVDKIRAKDGDNVEIYYFDDHPKYLSYGIEYGIDHVCTFDNEYVKSCTVLDQVEIFKDQKTCFKTMIDRIFKG